MKKRSLLAAVAMLIVSAILLTTSTYAWFASGNRAEVTAISGTISNSDGSLSLSADGGSTWKDTIGESDFTSTTLSKASTYVCVDADTSGGSDPVFNRFTLASGTLTKESTCQAGTHYTKFSFKLKSSADATVTVAPAFSATAAFGYGYVLIDGTPYLYGSNGNRSYFSLPAATTTANDTNGNDIIDGNDTGAPTLTQNTTANTASITLNMDGGDIVDFVVYLWAEGQDSACTGNVDTSSIGMGFVFTK